MACVLVAAGRTYAAWARSAWAYHSQAPTIVLSLGFSAARTLADLALPSNRWFTPHTRTNGIGVLANLHLCCGVGGGPFLEPGWTPERHDFMLAEPLRIDADGTIGIGAGAGLGIALDEEAVARYSLGPVN